jgi:hypothetical protein
LLARYTANNTATAHGYGDEAIKPGRSFTPHSKLALHSLRCIYPHSLADAFHYCIFNRSDSHGPMQFFATLALCRAPATFPSAPLRRLTPAHLCISCHLTLPRCRRTGHGAGFERRCTSFLHPPLSCLFDPYYAATERRPRACAQPRPSVPDVCVHLAGAWATYNSHLAPDMY